MSVDGPNLAGKARVPEAPGHPTRGRQVSPDYCHGLLLIWKKVDSVNLIGAHQDGWILTIVATLGG